ncbi:vitrin isoform X2 [Fukomys damarensis]|uniref:vitrin isoform X2 n=1 Tax=Fukomys damarensis TaxID=885580 RepID=UPI001455CB5D|nr:vitrin isoform X2 [Fukomys damarensis]
MGIVVLTMKASVIEMFLVLLVTGIHSNKELEKKSKRPKFTVPQIDCDVKAGKIINPEFIVKCPAGCRDPKYHVYGTGIYASYSSICGAAVHSGVLDNSGGKILVQKVAGQSSYKGSYSNGVQSVSLPRWRESFIVSESKPKKGVTYPTALIYSSSKTPATKADETSKAYQRPSVPGTTAQPMALMQVLATLEAEATHTALPKPSLLVASTRPLPMGHRSWETDCKVDLSFLIDGSSSIGKRRFRIQKQFLADVAQALDIGPSGPLMGVVQYGDNPATQFNLKTHTNSRDLKAAIEKITLRGGLSNAGRAISFVTKNFFSKANGNRGSAPNVAVVMLDGWPTDRVEETSRLTRESGINVFFITIEAAVENEKQYAVEPNFANKAVCKTNGYYSFNVQSWFGLRKMVQPLVKRICDTDRLACSKTCLNSADIGFVIDGSSSVGTGNFRTVLQFVANLSKEFEISDTDTRIGAVQYTYEQRLEFGFDKYHTKADVLNAIKSVGYWSGGTSTGAAIHYALEQLFKKSKPSKRKLMILITDGRSYDDVRLPAMAAHQKGVITYAIGVAWAAQDELDVIATHPARDHSFFVDEFDNLHTSVPKVIRNICTEFNAQPRN